MSFHVQVIVAIFILATFSISGCSNQEEQEPPEKHVKAESTDSHTIFLSTDLRQRVEIGKPFFADISEKLHVPGQIKVNETKLVQVGASFAGRIVEVYAHLGDSVVAGTKLARITSPELVQAQLAYLRANSLAVLAERAAIRARQLFAEDVISAAELQRRTSESQVANAELSATKDQLLLLGVDNQAIQDLTHHGRFFLQLSLLPHIMVRLLHAMFHLGKLCSHQINYLR